jgi:hypothetical protein
MKRTLNGSRINLQEAIAVLLHSQLSLSARWRKANGDLQLSNEN